MKYAKDGRPTKTNTERSYIRHYKWERILSKCQLAREFEEGKYWIYYNELLHLTLNYGAIEGGITRIHNTVDRVDFYNEEKNPKAYSGYNEDQHARIDTIHAYNYIPSNCSKQNCPFFEQCESTTTNIVNLGIEDKLGTITVTEDYRREYEPVEEVWKKAKAIFEEVLTNDEIGIHIIQAQTGLGKTEILVNADYSREDTIIAFPRHELKEEVMERMIASGKAPVMTLERPELPNKEDEDTYRHLMQIQLTKQAHAFYTQKAKELAAEHPEFREYLDNRDQVHGAPLVVTTHEKALLTNTDAELEIYDEDIFPSLVRVDTITVNEIDTLATILSRYTSLDPFFEEIQENIKKEKERYLKANKIMVEAMEEGDDEVDRFAYEPQQFETPRFTYDIDRVAQDIFKHRDKFTSNIMDFLKSNYYKLSSDLSTVQYVRKRELDLFKKIIIFSATANEVLWKTVYGSAVKFYRTGLAKNKGKIIQVADNSFSRTDLIKNFDKRIEQVKKILPETVKNVITFKSLESKFKREGYNVITHFGATSGIDEYKGQDIAVVGTYHIKEDVYKLVGALCGVRDYGGIQRRVIERNGFKFTFMTYDNRILREIQFYYIETELQQAIGRARLLREDCTVYVFSNLPIPEVDRLTVRGREVNLKEVY